MTNDIVFSKARTLIQKHEMLANNSKVLVALSGGADSVTLLFTLRSLKAELGIAHLAAVHIHHQLRGEEADRDARFVASLCKQWNVPLFLHHTDVGALAKTQKIGIEEAGRQARYTAFDKLCKSEGFTHVATAHTASDNTETVLLHLARGTGVGGLAGIPPVREQYIRPLLTCTREEIEAFCKEHQLPFVTDSTNNDVTYTRNRVRNRIVPELYTINPRIHEAVTRLSNMACEDESYWAETTQNAIHAAKVRDDIYSATAIARLPKALQRRVIHRLLTTYNGTCEERHVRDVMEHLDIDAAVTLGDHKTVTIKQGYLTLHSDNDSSCKERVLKAGETYCFGNTCYHATVWDRATFEKNQKIHKILLQFTCDYDKIKGTAFVRARREGDTCSPYLRGGRRTLKKWFNAEKIPAACRDTIPVVADEEGIALVVGLGCDKRTAIDDTTQHVLVFYITKEGKTYA